ncbi:MAG: hypothetical protein AAGI90_04900 [Chlamydiota bacterium]
MQKEMAGMQMGLKDTSKELEMLLEMVTFDLEKAVKGNKAASQRVRTGTIQLEKLGKKYRQQSMSDEKKRKAKPLAKKSSVKKTVRKKSYSR